MWQTSLNWVNIGSDNGLSPVRHQAITWTIADLLSFGHRNHISVKFFIEHQALFVKKMHLKMSSAKWLPFCLGLNVTIGQHRCPCEPPLYWKAPQATNQELRRLLHSPSLVAVGLSSGCETWPPIGWHHPFVIGWSKDRWALPSAPLHYGFTWSVGIPNVFQTPVTVPLHCPNGRQLPAVWAVQRDCDRVKELLLSGGILGFKCSCIKCFVWLAVK